MIRALLLALVLSAPALAADRDAISGAVPPDGPSVPAGTMVQQRLLVKEGHWFFSAGFGWLARGDYYDNPGFSIGLACWPKETIGLEVRFTQFFSSMTGPAQTVFQETGIKPDAQMPQMRLLAGVRHSLTYGKLATSTASLHFDFQIAAHAGTLITDQSTTPAFDVAAAVLARLSPHWFLQLDATVMGTVESRVRSSALSFGFLPELSIGVSM